MPHEPPGSPHRPQGDIGNDDPPVADPLRARNVLKPRWVLLLPQCSQVIGASASAIDRLVSVTFPHFSQMYS